MPCTSITMLRAHQDQENLVSIHQANAATKQHGTTRTLQPKTPGARFPKTPLKVPLNDENEVRGLGGKSILTNKTKGDRAQWQTPAGKQTSQGGQKLHVVWSTWLCFAYKI